MQLTNEDIINAHTALEWLSGERLNQETALVVTRMKRALKPLREDVGQANDNIIKELGDITAKEPISADKMPEFLERRKELMEIEIEVDIKPLKLSQLWARDYQSQERVKIDMPPRFIEQLGVLLDLEN